MGDFVYAISSGGVTVTNLSSLETVDEVTLSPSTYYDYYNVEESESESSQSEEEKEEHESSETEGSDSSGSPPPPNES